MRVEIEDLDRRLGTGEVSSPHRTRGVFESRGGAVLDLRRDNLSQRIEKKSLVLPDQVVAFDKSSDLSASVRRDLSNP